eukprot:CAMPEP_0198538864 /NCGR_PEP_ID=MMETSP1462-20131121/48104_1 /TAXON_ID=1333877 /ORGANISM="Brandtodinium nutriculum, Strain RCC3387" /LENGTH=72 /DNA_ID=CAMNT_0044268899 /DNA_START=188 /DNA_END=403 /DNA_ORIENTATION=-
MSMPIWGKYVRALIIEIKPFGKQDGKALATNGSKGTSLPMYTFGNVKGYCESMARNADVTMKQSHTFPCGDS